MKFSQVLGIAAAYLVLANTAALAKEVSLAWDPNTESVAGYKLYYKAGTNSPYNGTGAAQGPSPVNVGMLTQTTLTGLEDNQTWCFAVSAYNSAGQESPLSAEVCADPLATSPTPKLHPPKVKRVK